LRILVVSDLHANPAALAAIREPFDACLCLGDLVEYGPDPAACIDWVRQVGAVTVRGNHDHGAAQEVETQGLSGFRYLTMATRKTTLPRLSPEDRRFLADLPTSRMLTLDGKRFLLVHASPRDPLDEYVPAEREAWAARLAGLKVDFLLVGHTHLQFALDVGSTMVVNPGSVGLQRDGDPRARYAIIENGRVELKRLEYDVEETIRAVTDSPLDPLAKQLLAEVYRVGRYVPISPANGGNGNGVYLNGTTPHPNGPDRAAATS
jgi:putative phosphoesterase